jgi:uncharacterized protein YdhG (YjbR/CyaY superfamily)
VSARAKAQNVDAYIAAFPPKVRSILTKIRRTIREAAPDAGEKISYGIPAFTLRRIVVYYAAFKAHIGVFPPVRGDAELQRDLARYRNPRGNLRFPLDEPMPYDLIRRVAQARVAEIAVKAAPRPRKK